MTLHVKTATPDLATSEAYYRDLGFTKVADAPVLYTDGSVLVEIDADRFARPALVVRRDSWDGLLDELAGYGPLHALEGGRVTAAPSGTRVHLMDGAREAPAAMRDARPSVLGSYAGVSIESMRIADSRHFWELLGFSVDAGDVEQGWLTLKDASGFAISLMNPLACPHMFVNPSLTYFNGGRNPEVIAEIRRRGVPIAEEVTVFNDRGEVDNVVLRDPGGLGFFVFND